MLTHHGSSSSASIVLTSPSSARPFPFPSTSMFACPSLMTRNTSSTANVKNPSASSAPRWYTSAISPSLCASATARMRSFPESFPVACEARSWASAAEYVSYASEGLFDDSSTSARAIAIPESLRCGSSEKAERGRACAVCSALRRARKASGIRISRGMP